MIKKVYPLILKEKILVLLVSLYFILGIIFNFLTHSKPITFIFENVFNSDISFLINKKSETIEKYTSLFDEKFFNLLLIFPLLIIIIFSIIKLKKILFSKNFLNLKLRMMISHII